MTDSKTMTQKMELAELAGFLVKMKADIERLAQFKERAWGVSREVLDDFFELGMMFHRQPELKETEVFKQFYEDTWRLLIGRIDIVQFPTDATHAWECASRDWCDYDGDGNSRFDRSALQFFVEIYDNDIFLAEPLEEIDEAFEKKQENGGIYAEPERTDMPESHWWWRWERPEAVKRRAKEETEE